MTYKTTAPGMTAREHGPTHTDIPYAGLTDDQQASHRTYTEPIRNIPTPEPEPDYGAAVIAYMAVAITGFLIGTLTTLLLVGWRG